MWAKLSSLFFKRPERPLQPAERKALDAVPFLHRLDKTQRDRFVGLARRFLDEVYITGIQNIRPSEAERAWIAASCALLYVGRPEWPFPPVRQVSVSPVKFAEHDFKPAKDGPYAGYFQSCMRSGKGHVALTRDMLAHSFEKAGDGYHVGLHEFAHALDEKSGLFDGVPTRLPPELAAAWLGALEKAKTSADELKGILRKYAARDSGETFAVAVEAFFERPLELRHEQLKLYELLAAFFAQDPAAFEAKQLGPAIETRAEALVSQWRTERGQQTLDLEGRLVWRFTRKGMHRHLRARSASGALARAVTVAPEQLHANLLDRLDDEVEVNFDRYGKEIRHVRPRGLTFGVWPAALEKMAVTLAAEFPWSGPAQLQAALARAEGQTPALKPKLSTTLDGRMALELCERAPGAQLERLAGDICQRFGGRLVQPPEGPAVPHLDLRLGQTTLRLMRHGPFGVQLVSRSAKGDDKLRELAAALGAAV